MHVEHFQNVASGIERKKEKSDLIACVTDLPFFRPLIRPKVAKIFFPSRHFHTLGLTVVLTRAVYNTFHFTCASFSSPGKKKKRVLLTSQQTMTLHRYTLPWRASQSLRWFCMSSARPTLNCSPICGRSSGIWKALGIAAPPPASCSWSSCNVRSPNNTCTSWDP